MELRIFNNKTIHLGESSLPLIKLAIHSRNQIWSNCAELCYSLSQKLSLYGDSRRQCEIGCTMIFLRNFMVHIVPRDSWNVFRGKFIKLWIGAMSSLSKEKGSRDGKQKKRQKTSQPQSPEPEASEDIAHILDHSLYF